MKNSKSIALKIKEIASHGIVYGAGTALESLLQILIIPLFLNKFSPVQYGAFSLIQTTASMAAAFFYLGGSTALSRFYFDAKTKIEQKIWFSHTLFLTVFGSVLMILLVYIFGEFIVRQLFGDLTFINTFYILFGSFSLTIINTIFFILIRLLKKSTWFVMLKLISLISSISLIFLLINLMNNILDATALGFLIGQVIVILIMLIKFSSSVAFTFDVSLIIKYLKFGIPMAISGLLFMAIDWVIRFYVNKDLGAENLGLYSMGLKLGSLIQAGYITPFALIWSTVRMEYRKDNNTQDFFNYVTTYYFLAGFFIILIVSININDIISFITSENIYESSLILIPIILFSQLIFGTINILDYGIYVNNKTAYYTIFYFTVLFFVFFASFFLINYIGIIGAAIVHLLGNITIALLVYIRSNTYFPIKINSRTLFPSLLSCLLLLEFSKFFSIVFDKYDILQLLIKNLFIICLFLISVYAFLPILERKKIKNLLKIE